MKEVGNLYDFKLENQGLKYILENKPKDFKDRIENGILKIKAEYYEELEKIGAIIKNYKSEKDNYEEYEFPIVDTENSKLKSNITKGEYEILNAIWNFYILQFKDKERTLCESDLLFSELQANLQNGTPVVLGVGSHAVNAISLIQDLKDPNKYKIAIYDNNHPGEIRYINLTRYKQNKFQLDFTAWTNEYGYKCTYDKGYGVEESICLSICYPQIEETDTAYATLYDDGTLVISELDETIKGKTVVEKYGDISKEEFATVYNIPWRNDREKITTVDIVGKVKPKYLKMWFWDLSKLEKINNLSNLDTSNVINMESMFNGCSSLTSLDLSSFNTTNVNNMDKMFYGCSTLASLDLSGFNTTNVTNMRSMFNGCSSLTSLDLSRFNTSNVNNMDDMFYGCSALTSLNLSNFNTNKVTTMYCMFDGCSSLTSLNLSNFDTSNVRNMQGMFVDCSNLTNLNLSNFDTSNVTKMGAMFRDCGALTSLDLSSFNTTNVKDMGDMFAGCGNLTTIYVGANWNTDNATKTGMFYNCGTRQVTII